MRSTSQKKKRKKKPSLRARVVGVVAAMVGLGALSFGLGVIWLFQQMWNSFVPAAFGGGALTLTETACGIVLAIVVVLALPRVKR
ncbi:hypothetical protein LCGC14_1440350 [marine sediment metagenome]|uniref:Uncharacterized protein n=2 Tax=marine sediment metagenome TaxID=412755 RepID=A0A0F9M1G9_9ZZZZ